MPIAALATSFLIPLVIAPHLLFYYDITPKVALIFMAAAAGLAFVSFRFDSLRSFAGTSLGRWYVVAAAASVAICILAASLSANRSLAWNGSNWRRYGALTECASIVAAVTICAYVAGHASRLRALMQAVCAAGLIASLYGIAQYFRWDPFQSPAAYEAGEGIFKIVRPPSTMGHADYFAAFLLWPVFVGLGLMRESRRGFASILGISASVAGMAAIILSGSRGATIALGAGLCLACLFLRPKFRPLVAGLALAALSLGAFYLSPAGARLRARVHWIGEDRAGGARLLLWRDSLRMAAAKPLTGFGPDNFVSEFPRFQSVELARAYPDFSHESPHNIFLDSLTEEGLGGMLALAAIAVVGLIAGARSFASGDAMQAGAFAGLAATLVAHQFIAFTAPTAFYFYLGAGLLAGIGAKPAPSSPNAPGLRWATLAGTALFAALAFRLVAADAMLATADRRLNAGNPRAAAEAYRAALNRSWAGVSADLYFSRRWAAASQETKDVPSRLYYLQIAVGAASLAARLPEQRQNGWYTLAIYAASRQDPVAVESALRSTIAAGSNWYKPHWALARLLFAEKRWPESQAEASLALKLNAGKDPEVASTLSNISSSGGLPR
ncbi:MAG TPA: O-antigen ligase family protein [Bryobacteraceae bacterium]|jgi:O-antigen ligase